MVHADKKCMKIQAEDVPFSNKLVLAGCHMKVGKLVIRHKERKTGIPPRIRCATKRCGFKQVLGITLHTAC